MNIYLDTADVNEIKKYFDLGIVAGVTTNPTIISRTGKEFITVINEIIEIVKGLPVNAEVISLDAEGMITEGRELAALNPSIVVKIPMCMEGLKAVKVLSDEGITTNVTLVFSVTQALMAARAGATYVSSFLGRVDDVGGDGIALIQDVITIFKEYGIKSKVIAASVRHMGHVIGCAKAGVDICTIPSSLIPSMANHPLTTQGLNQFLEDWKKVPSKK
jgi:transaldolase